MTERNAVKTGLLQCIGAAEAIGTRKWSQPGHGRVAKWDQEGAPGLEAAAKVAGSKVEVKLLVWVLEVKGYGLNTFFGLGLGQLIFAERRNLTDGLTGGHRLGGWSSA